MNHILHKETVQLVLPGLLSKEVYISDYNLIGEEINGQHGRQYKSAYRALNSPIEIGANDLGMWRFFGQFEVSDELRNVILDSAGEGRRPKEPKVSDGLGGGAKAARPPKVSLSQKYGIRTEIDGGTFFSLQLFSIHHIIQEALRKEASELRTLITPAYIGLRSGIRANWANGELVDMVSSSTIYGKGTPYRPLKFKDGVTSTNMHELIPNIDDAIKGKVHLLPSAIIRFTNGNADRTSRPLLDPYGDSAPSIRSVAHHLIQEIDLMSDHDLLYWACYFLIGADSEIMSLSKDFISEWIWSDKDRSVESFLTGQWDEDGNREVSDVLPKMHESMILSLAAKKDIHPLDARLSEEGKSIGYGWIEMTSKITGIPSDKLNQPYSLDDIMEMVKRKGA